MWGEDQLARHIPSGGDVPPTFSILLHLRPFSFQWFPLPLLHLPFIFLSLSVFFGVFFLPTRVVVSFGWWPLKVTQPLKAAGSAQSPERSRLCHASATQKIQFKSLMSRQHRLSFKPLNFSTLVLAPYLRNGSKLFRAQSCFTGCDGGQQR